MSQPSQSSNRQRMSRRPNRKIRRPSRSVVLVGLKVGLPALSRSPRKAAAKLQKKQQGRGGIEIRKFRTSAVLTRHGKRKIVACSDILSATPTTISFPFDERKAVQVAGRLVIQSGGEMNYMALIKLLVEIDRKALLEFGRPITGDKIMAMEHGLVLSRILNFVSQKKQDEPQSFWHNFIPRPAPYVFTVKFSGSPETSALSEAEIALIDSVYSEHRTKSQWELEDMHHKLPEWIEAKPGKSSVAVSFERIMEHGKKSPEEIRAIARESAADRAMHQVLALPEE